MAGRPPKPTKLLEMSGAFKKNPQRARARAKEPQPGGVLGAPPQHFLAETTSAGRLLQMWKELVAQVPTGVLTSADRWLVECACGLMVRKRFEPSSFKAGDQAQLTNLLGKMGMTPVDRARMGGSGADAGDHFDAFMRGGKAGK